MGPSGNPLAQLAPGEIDKEASAGCALLSDADEIAARLSALRDADEALGQRRA